MSFDVCFGKVTGSSSGSLNFAAMGLRRFSSHSASASFPLSFSNLWFDLNRLASHLASCCFCHSRPPWYMRCTMSCTSVDGTVRGFLSSATVSGRYLSRTRVMTDSCLVADSIVRRSTTASILAASVTSAGARPRCLSSTFLITSSLCAFALAYSRESMSFSCVVLSAVEARLMVVRVVAFKVVLAMLPGVSLRETSALEGGGDSSFRRERPGYSDVHVTNLMSSGNAQNFLIVFGTSSWGFPFIPPSGWNARETRRSRASSMIPRMTEYLLLGSTITHSSRRAASPRSLTGMGTAMCSLCSGRSLVSMSQLAYVLSTCCSRCRSVSAPPGTNVVGVVIALYSVARPTPTWSAPTSSFWNSTMASIAGYRAIEVAELDVFEAARTVNVRDRHTDGMSAMLPARSAREGNAAHDLTARAHSLSGDIAGCNVDRNGAMTSKTRSSPSRPHVAMYEKLSLRPIPETAPVCTVRTTQPDPVKGRGTIMRRPMCVPATSTLPPLDTERHVTRSSMPCSGSLFPTKKIPDFFSRTVCMYEDVGLHMYT
eukprot:PhM_4_TR10805/c0_g1_i1/m.7105